MAELDHQLIKDQITEGMDFWISRKEIEKLRPVSRYDILGMKFKPGDKVTDKVTGEEVEVAGGTKAIVGVQGT